MVRLSPLYSATVFSEKTKRNGLDGNIWEVQQMNKSKKWVRSSDSKQIKEPSNKLRLKGSYKNKKKLKTFDIIKSVILTKTCFENWLDIRRDTKLNSVHIYHSYDTKTYSGRWYNNLNNNYKLDGKQYILTYTIPEYEDWDSNKIIKNAKIKIYFTEKGWTKFVKYFI